MSCSLSLANYWNWPVVDLQAFKRKTQLSAERVGNQHTTFKTQNIEKQMPVLFKIVKAPETENITGKKCYYYTEISQIVFKNFILFIRKGTINKKDKWAMPEALIWMTWPI